MKKLIYAIFFALIAGQALSCDREYMIALNMYREARGESLRGQLAVAEVTLNRVSHPDFPNTICAVISQKNQFTWYGKHGITNPNNKKFRELLVLSRKILDNKVQLTNTGALYFVRSSTRPAFLRNKKHVADIGNHSFYK